MIDKILTGMASAALGGLGEGISKGISTGVGTKVSEAINPAGSGQTGVQPLQGQAYTSSVAARRHSEAMEDNTHSRMLTYQMHRENLQVRRRELELNAALRKEALDKQYMRQAVEDMSWPDRVRRGYLGKEKFDQYKEEGRF